jgi:hypothetical protein
MPDPATTLALSAATALVGQMATDAWEGTKTLFLRVFRRGEEGQETAVHAQLELGAAQVAGATDVERARQMLLPAWQLQLETLLRDHPEVEAELREILTQIEAPQAAQEWHQTNIARDHGTTYAAQGGNVVHYSGNHYEGNQVPTAPDPSGEPQ